MLKMKSPACHHHPCFLPVVLATLLVSSARATPITASVGFGVQAHFGSEYRPSGPIADVQSYPDQQLVQDAWGVVGSDLHANANVTSNDGLGHTVNAYGNAAANWTADGNAGSFTLGYGWSAVSNPYVISQIGTAQGTDLRNWAYTFVADANGLFVLNYAVSGYGWVLGSRMFDIIVNEGPTITNPFISGSIYDESPPSKSSFDDAGQFTKAVVAGQEYTIVIANSFGIASGIPTGSADVTGEFNWTLPTGGTVASVPDTGSTCALLGLGLGGLGFAKRRALAKKAAA